jgi:threonine/homoserine/homoserine lactone efflux protein
MTPLYAVIGIVAVGAITPGPNNLIVLEAAVRGGCWAAIPPILGVMTGAVAMLALVSAGAGAAFEAEPMLRSLLTVAGCLYLVWLGLVLIRESGDRERGDGTAQPRALPRTTLGVFAFQLLNPKCWVLVLTAIAATSGEASFAALSAVFAVVSGVCLTFWALLGRALSAWLRQPRAGKWFDRAMGALLIGSAALLVV